MNTETDTNTETPIKPTSIYWPPAGILFKILPIALFVLMLIMAVWLIKDESDLIKIHFTASADSLKNWSTEKAVDPDYGRPLLANAQSLIDENKRLKDQLNAVKLTLSSK